MEGQREVVCHFENQCLHEHWMESVDPKTTMVLQMMEQLPLQRCWGRLAAGTGQAGSSGSRAKPTSSNE